MLETAPKQLIEYIMGSLIQEIFKDGQLEPAENILLERVRASLPISLEEFETIKQNTLENLILDSSRGHFHARSFLRIITPELLKYYSRDEVSEILLELAGNLRLDSEQAHDRKGYRNQQVTTQYNKARSLISKGKVGEGISLMEQIARLGNPEAQYTLGSLFMQGKLIKKNEDLARTWFQMASDNGHTASQGNLGIMYHKGLGVTKNPELAFEYAIAAARKGYAKSQLQVAQSYQFGWGVAVNFKEAETWYLKASKSGKNMVVQIAQFYISQASIDEINLEKAKQVLEKGIRDGQLDCAAELAKLLLSTEIDSNEYLIKILKEASDRGHAESSKILGDLYAQGYPVKQNWSKACTWYALSAKQGSKEGFLQLGLYFCPETGPGANSRLASLFYHLAHDNNNPVTSLHVQTCSHTLADFTQDEIENWSQFLPNADIVA